MRRSLVIPALLLILGSALCWAQRGGGGHMGGGFRAGGSGMRASGGGFRAGGAMRGPGSGMRSGGNRFAGGGRSGFHGPGSFHPPHRGPVFVPRHGFHGHGFGHRNFYPYYNWYPSYAYYGGPLWDWNDSSYDARFNNDDYARYQTAAEINRLSDEVQQLREEREYNEAASQPAPPPAPQPAVQATAQPDLPVVVVFLDKRIQEVNNYAVANEMLVVLDGNRRTKFRLADIDLAATMKLNDERGVDFEIPNPVMN
jgi:hypothetical protein